MKTATKRAVISAAALLLTAATLTACSNGSSTSGASSSSGSSSSTGSSASGASNAKIGLLLPDTDNARYAADDLPLFKQEIATKCPGCTVLYQNAAGSAAKQQSQAQSMLTQGVKVLVISAEDGKAAASIVTLAKAKNVPVVAYDRLINSADVAAYISFDNEKVGALQGAALVARMKQLGVPKGAGIIASNGDPADPNAAQFKKGALSAITPSGYVIKAEFDSWTPADVQSWANGAISKVGPSNIKGVYSANDANAGAIIAALKGKGVTKLPPITGQDAALQGIQNVLSGQQYMTVYKAYKPEAFGAADIAIDLVNGTTPNLPDTATTVSGASVKAELLTPVPVTAKDIEGTVVKDGQLTAAQICTSAYAAACKTYGIK